ncbi:hypothetical protein GCM10018787_41230 [Streptomyces thermodiastaticus]|nr:hypothetical protein GCM10018787_41230 [Streptomyces thermodiastaticus]
MTRILIVGACATGGCLGRAVPQGTGEAGALVGRPPSGGLADVLPASPRAPFGRRVSSPPREGAPAATAAPRAGRRRSGRAGATGITRSSSCRRRSGTGVRTTVTPGRYRATPDADGVGRSVAVKLRP